jgi:glucose-6-phosphate 1-dehydrogenase
MVSRVIPVEPFELIVFGATGDLARKKILPALWRRFRAGQMPEGARVIGAARTELDTDGWRRMVAGAIGPAEGLDAFLDRLAYVTLDATGEAGWPELRAACGAPEVRAVYFSVAPALFAPLAERVRAHGLADGETRVVVEKPFGHDLASARTLNAALAAQFSEDQIYRIDHYLGKETVQNLMAVRFGNMLFEPLWRRDWIRDVQISVSEQLGVNGRAGFYDRTGALRDMVQNHMLQLLCIIAMEPPTDIGPDAVRDEKLKVLRALKRLEGQEALRNTVRGQYRAGAIAGQPVIGYLDETDVPPDSVTETFVAMRTEIENWRWAGVPFYLRTGKRLQERAAEVIINFRDVPHSIFGVSAGAGQPNRLVLKLQPDEGVKLHMMAKSPGDRMQLRPVALNLDFAEAFQQRPPDAYERLLMDVLRGRLTLFMRRDELYAAWSWIEPILEAWNEAGDAPKPYTAGTWGPAASSALLAREDANWHEER